MAEPFDTLIRVQEHDTALDQLRQRKRSLPARVELAEVEARLATVTAEGHMLRTQVEDLTARQRLLEDQIAAAAKRRQELELRMLTGGISASRDILAMDEEVQHLAERQAQFEEDELALVEEEDPLDVALAENVQEAAALEVEVSRLQEIIAEEVATTHERVQITKNGRGYVVLMAAEDLEAIEATLELLSDPEAQARLGVAEVEVAHGDVLDEQAVRRLVASEGRDRSR
jgi:prevent-host-death family protein